jgi:hypothetical protein
MIRLGARNTIESSTLENGFRIDNLNRFISDNRRLPPKRGQAWNYASFLENLYRPNELYPNNEVYTFQDVRRQYDFKTDVAYKVKESPSEAIEKARQEYIQASEAAKEAPVTLPFVDKIEELALQESLEQFNVPVPVREQFFEFENKIKSLQIPDDVKKSMRAIAYMDFLKNQSIQPVEVVDPTTGEVMFKSATMAGAVDKSASTGYPSVVKETLRMTPKELMGAELARRMGIPFVSGSQARALFGGEPAQPVKSTYGDKKEEIRPRVSVLREEDPQPERDDWRSKTLSRPPASSLSESASVIRDETPAETKRSGAEKDYDDDDDYFVEDEDGFISQLKGLISRTQSQTPSTKPTQLRPTQKEKDSRSWLERLTGRNKQETEPLPQTVPKDDDWDPFEGRKPTSQQKAPQPAPQTSPQPAPQTSEQVPRTEVKSEALKNALDELFIDFSGLRAIVPSKIKNLYEKISAEPGYGNLGKIIVGSYPRSLRELNEYTERPTLVKNITLVRNEMSKKYNVPVSQISRLSALHEMLVYQKSKNKF